MILTLSPTGWEALARQGKAKGVPKKALEQQIVHCSQSLESKAGVWWKDEPEDIGKDKMIVIKMPQFKVIILTG